MSEELKKAFELVEPIPEVAIEYRLYYDSEGKPITMSSHNHPEGNYIVITKDVYDRANYNCLVIGGKLIFDLHHRIKLQLKRSSSGMRVVKNHASIVAEEEYPDIEYYDRNC